ncbi:hypothetical protein F6S84_00595 [Bifidobacterium dentium]|nr:hypothetical protein [Bifidobacterium dentium]NEG53411.1 hypothetical protein [Bifidobacterium dentium]
MLRSQSLVIIRAVVNARSNELVHDKPLLYGPTSVSNRFDTISEPSVFQFWGLPRVSNRFDIVLRLRKTHHSPMFLTKAHNVMPRMQV